MPIISHPTSHISHPTSYIPHLSHIYHIFHARIKTAALATEEERENRIKTAALATEAGAKRRVGSKGREVFCKGREVFCKGREVYETNTAQCWRVCLILGLISDSGILPRFLIIFSSRVRKRLFGPAVRIHLLI